MNALPNYRSAPSRPVSGGRPIGSAGKPQDAPGAYQMSVTLREPLEFFDALERHPPEAPLIVDFDETLWLRNSTELFLDSVRPRFLAAIVLQLLGALRPWRLFGREDHHRDWIRVGAVLLVAPWSLWRWRREARALGPRYVNRELLQALEARPRQGPSIVSFGFREIVEPLLRAISPNLRLLESCSLRSGAKLRAMGKAAALERDYGADFVASSLVITDSVADTDLLNRSGRGFLVEWPEARYEQSGLKPLMPFVYLGRVKRPDEKYFRNAILGHDLPVLLLAFAVVSTAPLHAIAAIIVFVLAFFTFYEIGYYENDKLGLKLESQPKVFSSYHTLGKNFSPGFAWTIALLLAGVASLISYQTASWVPDALGLSGLLAFLAVWSAFALFMFGMRLLFRWLNVIAPRGRIVPMLGLQVGRVLGYAVVLETTIIGALFCVAHGLSRWLPYAIYRFGGERRDFPNHLNVFMLLCLFVLVLAIGGSLQLLFTWQAGLIVGYAGLRAGKDLLNFYPQLRPIGRAPA